MLRGRQRVPLASARAARRDPAQHAARPARGDHEPLPAAVRSRAARPPSCSSRSPAGRACHMLSAGRLRALERRLRLRSYDTVLCYSEFVRDAHRRRGSGSRTPSSSPRRSTRRARCLRRKGRSIIAVGRFFPADGREQQEARRPDRCVRAAARRRRRRLAAAPRRRLPRRRRIPGLPAAACASRPLVCR